MLDFNVATDKINNMEVDEIRSWFGELGVQGRLGCVHSCVVAMWLLQVTGADCVSVDAVEMVEFGPMDQGQPVLNESKVSDSVARFIERFDDGEFPELISDELCNY